MQIISVPTVFSCKTPTAGWLNLAQVRRLQFESSPKPVAVITWHNGDVDNFFNEDATAIFERWSEATAIFEQRCCNHRFNNRRL